MEPLQHKKVLVLGATGAIGSETARLLHTSGAKVFLGGRDGVKLKALGESLDIPDASRYLVDFQSPVTLYAAVENILTSQGNLDIVVNATGIGIIKPFENLSEKDFLTSLQVNLLGVFHLLQAVLPSMKEQKKGLILNIPGVLGKSPMAGAAAYAASKYGLNGMLKSIREELKRTEIRITNVYLGGVDSPFWDTIDLKVQREKMILAREAGKTLWFLCQQPRSAVVSEMVVQPFNHQVI